MSKCSLFSGPDSETVTTRALSWAASNAGEGLDSVLCLTQSRERADILRHRWQTDHDQLRFTCTTLDDYVSELYEQETGNLADCTLSRVQRFRLVEAAIEQYSEADTEGPIAAIDAPANDLIDQVQGLFSLLEYAGYDSPEAIEHALLSAGVDGDDAIDTESLYGAFRGTELPASESNLAAQAETFSALYAEYSRLRNELYPEWQSVVAEQYLTLLDNDQFLTAISASVDVVILDGLTRLAPAEREVVARLAGAYPTVAVLPLTHASLTGDGIDDGVQRALDVYQALGFELEYRTPGHVNEARLSAVRNLYTPSQESASNGSVGVEITIAEPATEREEVRSTARRIRALLDDGAAPADIGVVVTDRATYRSVLAEVFLAYDIPFTFVNEIGIEQTLVGEAMQALLDLANPESQLQSLKTLAANALVSLDAVGIQAEEILRAATEVPDQRLESLLESLEQRECYTTAQGVRELVSTLDPDGKSLSAFTATLEHLLDELSVSDAVDTYSKPSEVTGSHRTSYEQSAWHAVERVLQSVSAVSPYLGDTQPAERVRRALLAELVSGPRQQPEYVRVYPLAEAEMRSFEHLFGLGLTMGNFPNESDTMQFFEAVNEADEEFGREHTGRRARYILGTLLTGSGTVTLSVPQHTVEGTEHVPAPVVTELKRYIDQGDIDTEYDALPQVNSEDIQHAYRAWAVREAFTTPTRATAALTAAEGLSATSREFAKHGVTCSWRRSQPGVSEHDAQLDDVVDSVYGAKQREAYSPSALEDYARCPFVFLMKNVLGFEEDYGDDRGITRADRGIYIHNVLAAFYRRLRSRDDGPVDLDRYTRSTLETTLLDVALEQLDELDDVETPFEKRTIGRLLSGLGEPERNPHHGFGAEGLNGLFVRFLETELDEQGDVVTAPTYFEGAMDSYYGDVEELSDRPVTVETPAGPVGVRGIVDRVDIADDSPRLMHVRDYKTGSTPARKDIMGGTKLQLPLYSLALETVLEERTGETHEAVAASYYKLKAPNDIDSAASQITSREALGSDSERSMASPVSQDWQLPFDTRREFKQFIRSVTAARVGQIATAIENGAFQPTLLAADLANCEDCTFRHTCDVRHHHQRETMSELAGGDHYLSERALDEEFDMSAYRMGGDE